MKIGHTYGHASGPSQDNCHFICLRYDERWGFKPDTGESWVFQTLGDQMEVVYGGLGWFTGLWRSPAGHVYVTDSVLGVHINQDPSPRSSAFKLHKLDATLAGVWGIDDRFVVAWGKRHLAPVMFRWDGTSWAEMDSPGDVVAVHGIAPDLVYAVGGGGLIARWDGRAWTRLQSPATSVLSAVFVAAPDDLYAVGSGTRGCLLEGSTNGWLEVCNGPGPLYGVAKFRGDVWVGAAMFGLMKKDKNALVTIKPNIHADVLDARVNLLISSPGAIAQTVDGAGFVGFPVASAAAILKSKKPRWQR